MDLRIVKTKKGIREAFIELRKKTDLERIKVKDICSIALINKTTFYKYYQDIFALSDELEDEVLDLFWETFSTKDCLFSDPARFLADMPKALDVHEELFLILFRDRFNVSFPKMEKRFKEYYGKTNPSPYEDIYLSFVLGGVFHGLRTLKEEQKYDKETVVECITKIVEKLR